MNQIIFRQWFLIFIFRVWIKSSRRKRANDAPNLALYDYAANPSEKVRFATGPGWWRQVRAAYQTITPLEQFDEVNEAMKNNEIRNHMVSFENVW